jgi:TolB-like protein
MHRPVLIAALSLALGAGVAVAPAVAQDTRPGVAVLPFENGGSYGRDREDLEAMRRGIAGILIAELARHQGIRLVDRAETQRLLDEQNLAASGRVDAATAARVGRLVGARFMIAGTFLDLYGDFRIDARIIDVETGEILTVVRSDPRLRDRRELYRLIQSVAERITAEARFPVAGAAAAAPARDIPTDALTHFSRALLHEDRGDRAKATEYYQRALQVFPEFTEASEGLRKVRRQ